MLGSHDFTILLLSNGRSLKIQWTGVEGIVLGHGIFCHENVGSWKFFWNLFGGGGGKDETKQINHFATDFHSKSLVSETKGTSWVKV